MTDSWNDPDAPPPAAPPGGGPPPNRPELAYGGDPMHPPTTGNPPSDIAAPTSVPADESSWVRSVYLFGACATGGIMMIAGLLVAVGSLVSVIAPDSGLRDGWDRGLVGATAIANEGLDIFDDFNRSQLEDDFDQFCDGSTDDPFCDDLAERIDTAESAIPDELSDSVFLIRDEVHRQIRYSSAAKLVAGLAVAILGLLLFRFHSKQVSVYHRS